jgi:hypothetical protein
MLMKYLGDDEINDVCATESTRNALILEVLGRCCQDVTLGVKQVASKSYALPLIFRDSSIYLEKVFWEIAGMCP